MKALFIALFLIVMAGSLPAYAQTACTEIGCINYLTITVEPGIIDSFGHYQISIAADEEKITCKGVLPLRPCDKGATFTCNSKKIIVGENGCALPDGKHAISDIKIAGTPRRVMVGVNRDGKSTLIRTLKPVYRFVRPNGPTCEPQCIVSTVNLSKKPPAF